MSSSGRPVPAAGGGPRRVNQGGNTGAAVTLPTLGDPDVWLVNAILNAATVTITATGLTAGVVQRIKLIGVQDANGSRVLRFDDGSGALTVTGLPSSPGAPWEVNVDWDGTFATTYVVGASSAAPDADASTKGLVQLAGDLSGTAASPQIAAGAIVNADINAGAAIAESKLNLASDAAAGTASRRTLGTGATQAAAGNDARLSDTRTPTDGSVGTAKLASGLLDVDGTLAANSDTKIATQKAVKTYVDAHVGGGSVAIETLWLPRSPLSPGLRPGRTWRADFADEDLTNAMFDFAASAGSWTYGTDGADGGRAVVIPPTPYPAIGKITAKFGMLRNFEVAIRFKTPASVHTSTIVRAIGRYLSDDNLVALAKSFSTNSLDLFRRDKDTGSAHQTTITNVAHSLDTTAAHIYKLKLRAVDNVFWGKCWLDSTAEPDWQVVGRPGSGGGIRRDMGLAGIWFQDVNGGANVSELVVTELVPAGEDVVLNGDFQIMGAGNGSDDGWTSGVLGWRLPTISSPGNSLFEWVTAAGPDGASRRMLHLRRPTIGDGVLPQLTQDIYRRDEMVGNQLGGDNMDWLDANYIEVGVTSKVTNARHGAVASFLGFTAEAYWFDENGTITNISTGSSGYFKALGPNRANAAGDLRGDGQDGMGTWGWRRDLIRIDISAAKTARPNRITLSIGPHDNDTLVDDAWIVDITGRPVA